MVGKPHGAELTGKGGMRRRREAEAQQGTARSVQLHPFTCTGASVPPDHEFLFDVPQFIFMFDTFKNETLNEKVCA